MALFTRLEGMVKVKNDQNSNFTNLEMHASTISIISELN